MSDAGLEEPEHAAFVRSVKPLGHQDRQGLTDRVLDDPREPYTQLLVSSILQV